MRSCQHHQPKGELGGLDDEGGVVTEESRAISQLDSNISPGSLEMVLLLPSPPPPLELCYCEQDTVCTYDGARPYECRICHKKYFLGEGLSFDEKLFEDDNDYYKFLRCLI
jgi:hypothetical protein